MLKVLFLCMAFTYSIPSKAALMAGDIAFTALNVDEDGWALTTLVDIAPNTTIYFSDNEWQSLTSDFNSGEAFFEWNTGLSLLNAGQIVRFSQIQSASLSASVGSLIRGTGSSIYGLSASGDTLYAYLGSNVANPSQFLTAISNTTFSATGGLEGTGLTAGSNAIELLSAEYAEYQGFRSGFNQFQEYQPLLMNRANWMVLAGGDFSANSPNVSAFEINAANVVAVPEPNSQWMLLSGLFLIAFRLMAFSFGNRLNDRFNRFAIASCIIKSQ
jgi:hypothetical protein